MEYEGSSQNYRSRKALWARGFPKKGYRVSKKGKYKKTSLVHFVYPFVRTAVTTFNVMDTFTPGVIVVKLNALPDYTEFIALFDQYRITKVECTFVFDKNCSEVVATNNNLLPNLYTVEDNDDGVNMITAPPYFEYESFKIHRLDKPCKVVFHPVTNSPVYASSTFSGYSENAASKWIDTAYPASEFYGLKYAVVADMGGGVGSVQLGQLQIYTKVYLECQSVK